MNLKLYIKIIKNFLFRFQDIKFSGQVLFVVIVLMVSWSGVKTIQTNYNLQKQILKLNEEVKVQKLENNNLALENQYYNSKQYIELSARQNFGLGNPGETELIVPNSVAMSYVVTPPNSVITKVNNNSNQPIWQKNIQAWVNFFLHRSV